MLKKRVVTALLIFVLVLQLLPIRQAVKYFWVDNITVEEEVDMSKVDTKNAQQQDEDHKWLFEFNYSISVYISEESIFSFHTKEMLPPFHILDIQTPPPNRV